jgi:hypothetical protein
MSLPLRLLLVSLFSLSSFAQQVLDVHGTGGAADRGAGTLPVHIVVANRTDAPLSGVELILSTRGFQAPIELVSPAWACSEPLSFRQCIYSGVIEPHAEISLDVTLRFPGGLGRTLLAIYATYGGSARSFGDTDEVDAVIAKPFVVTRNEDAGADTLRAAIDAVNADFACATVPCRIEFALPSAGATEPWSTIQPLTPLPAIRGADVEIDGTTQTDTNPNGPDVELIGTSLSSGNGLDFRAARMGVRGLSIVGFPDNGVFYLPPVRGSRFKIENNFIGVTPDGQHALGNGSRGVVIAEGIVTDSDLRDNVIGGNARSGIFIVTQPEPGFPLSPVIRVTGNRIGVAAASDAPLGNGASGIFVGPRAEQVLIGDNVIAHNRHFGVAIAAEARWVQLGANRIFDHPLPGIDRGLNGPSPTSTSIESARYDEPSNTTTIVIQGSSSQGTFGESHYTLYANESVDADGYAEGEQLLTTAPAAAPGSTRTTVRASGDLRGKFVSATVTNVFNADGSLLYETGEFLRAVRVE